MRGSLDFGFEAEGVERWLVGMIDLKTDALRMRNLDHTNVGRASKGWKPRMDRSGDFCRERVREIDVEDVKRDAKSVFAV